jgi:hypothetical protein
MTDTTRANYTMMPGRRDRLQHRPTAAFVMLLGMLVSGVHTAVAQERDPDIATLEATPGQFGVVRGHTRSDVIVAWNGLAHDIAFAEDQFLTFKGQRAMAMMHLAMHDALNSIVPVYRRYAYTGPRVPADPVAAAAQAAYGVLLSEYPGQQPRLAAELAVWLGHVPNGTPRERGVDLGQAVALAILNRRSNDGFDDPGTYEFRSGPGEYQTTPPWNGFVAQPGFRFAKPFALDAPSQYRPSPPPPLTSTVYARTFREVKDYGAIDSARRSEDQTAYALWWMEFAEGSVNRLARHLTAERRTHLWVAARLFAHLDVALFDAYVATWDSKYEYNHWRPYTAVRAADTDNNPRTQPEAGWEPLRPTPPFPEYASAHATACAASFGILERALGNDVSFTMETTTAPPGMPTRAFMNFRAAAAECADSRVRLGWHFRYSTDAGLALGQRIAHHTVNGTLQKLEPRRHGDRK